MSSTKLKREPMAIATTPSWLLLILALLSTPAAAMAQGTGSPSGEPNLQGVWDFRTMTPLQRPRELADKDVLTAEEAASYEQAQAESREDYDAAPTVHAKFWLDYGTALTGDRRTSLIVDPPDGRIPALTEDARARAGARADKRERTHSIQDRSITERCVVGFNAGPPMNPGAYNNNVMLLQVPGMVVLHNEMVHEVRVIPLDGRDHLPDGVRQLRGDSRGHWEGPTLVVETTNFTDRTDYLGSGQDMRLIERFTRTDESTLLYEYTVEDPASFEHAWTAVVPMTRTKDPMFEFACHEGNYGLTNILSAARAEERRAAAGESR
ncbi:MAG: hypothetical protein O3A25_01000 [Acidobacteria bacterium]|nr:hypothetical protein [Acidobacteriota bacterium]